MANTTFTGPVRSEGGFLVVAKNAVTGEFSTLLTLASDGSVNLPYTSGSTSGSDSVEPVVVTNTMTGAGGVGGRSRFQLNANAALGGFSNAVKAITVYGASGKTTGLGSAIVAEMTMSAGTDTGTYAPVEIELNVASGDSLGTKTSMMFASLNGTGAATFDTSGVFANVQGLTAGSAGDTDAFNVPGGSFDVTTDISHGLKVRIGGAEFYLPLIPVADFADN
jgi:hypothetical protein